MLSAMRNMPIPRLVTLTFSLGIAACGGPETWQKPGVDDATIGKDTSDCRAAAEQEALRRYPYGFGAASAANGMGLSQQRDATNRATAEAAAFNACMSDKGYTWTSARAGKS
jgi:hypothetical protein